MGVTDRLRRAKPPRRWGPIPRLVLLLASLWPAVYMVLFMAWVVAFFVTQPDNDGVGAPGWFTVLLVLHLATFVLILLLASLYVWDVFQNDRLQGDRRMLWAIAIFFGNAIAMPLYWFTHIRAASKPAPPLTQSRAQGLDQSSGP